MRMVSLAEVDAGVAGSSGVGHGSDAGGQVERTSTAEFSWKNKKK